MSSIWFRIARGLFLHNDPISASFVSICDIMVLKRWPKSEFTVCSANCMFDRVFKDFDESLESLMMVDSISKTILRLALSSFSSSSESSFSLTTFNVSE
ncbi:hypothetical protein OGATHE_002549 [Ogataea polymorpha]|uniref:Uncharacterized protein n=1 Tax=Ogataea polymorpha TaxID=460523 RepID=A0A9P8PD08_9ASCO|nr:hypothetical protein OGATHE_002549 [Ogataea polymorpha]